MKKAKTDEEREKYKPRMGKRIISDKQARQLDGKHVEPESFLNDPTFIEPSSMDDTDNRPPTREEMMKQAARNQAQRAAEFKSLGRTGKEVLGELPPMNFKMVPRRSDDISSDESGQESDKENEAVDESMEASGREAEKEKEADETTPIAQQRSLGLVEPQSPADSVAGPAPLSTTPVRPDSGLKKPRMPAGRGGPPRHSTPKMNVRPRDSFGAAFNNISIIGPNTSRNAAPTERSGASASTTTNTRKSSTGSRGSGAPIMSSHDEEEEEAEEAAPANGTFVIDRPAEDAAADESAAAAAQHNGTYVVEGEEEREEEQQEEEEGEAVQVHVESVVMRRESVPTGPRARLSMDASMDGVEEGVEEVAVVGVAMRRVSARPQDATMMSIDEGGDEGGEESEGGGDGSRREQSQEMEDDVEMASAYNTPATPVRRQSMRPAKRPSLEHPLNATSSPMEVAMARRGLRDAMVRPKVSVVSMAGSTATAIGAGRKVSTGSVASSIPFEDLSHRSNLSMDSSTGEGRSYVEPKTPERTPRTTRLLRQSLAARELRQSQLPQQKLPILEEADMQGGGGGSEDEEMEEEEVPTELRGLRRGSATPVTPVNRLPRLSSKLQSSVDRLSQPRHHRQSPARPCSRMAASPARAATPLQRRAGPSTSAPSPSPARRLQATSFNASRGIRGGMLEGYTPNQRVDTTMMEDEGGAKSGLAPRIKRIPRREQPKKAAPLLDVSVEQSDIEEMRRHQAARNAILANASVDNDNQSKETSAFTDAPTTTPITSPTVHHRQHQHDYSFDFYDDRRSEDGEDGEESGKRTEDGEDGEESAQRREERREDGDEQEEEDDDVFERSAASVGGASSAASAASAADDSAVFVRPANPVAPIPTTPRSGGSRRSMASAGSRRSMLSDSNEDANNEDVDRLARRASEISIDSARRAPAAGAAAAAAAASFDGSFDFGGGPRTPQTPFRALQARDRDLFSTDTPGVHSHRTNSYMSTTEEEEWAANQDSRLWRGNVTTEREENEGEADDSQLSPEEDDGEVEEAKERVLAPRKLIAPTASPGVRRSTRTRMKPVRTWLGEQPQYANSPTTGGRRLVGVNEVVIKDKLFVKTGTADMQTAVLAKNKTAKQRAIANKKRKEQKGRGRVVLSEEEEDE